MFAGQDARAHRAPAAAPAWLLGAKPSQAERQKPYNKIQEILARDLPVLNLHQQPQYAVGTAKLQGLWQAANQQWWGSIGMK